MYIITVAYLHQGEKIKVAEIQKEYKAIKKTDGVEIIFNIKL